MSYQIIDRSPDLKKLRDQGYDLSIKEPYLLVSSIPYLNSQKEIKRGTLVASINATGGIAAKPDNHVAHFIGEFPCNIDGKPIENIRHPNGCVTLPSDIGINFSFSSTPKDGYNDFFHKMTSYIGIISAPAQAVAEVTARVYPVLSDVDSESLFSFFDSATSRAGIGDASMKLMIARIAIVGLGGTGSYVLDYLAKTPVTEIHLFDGDLYLNHNAFRAPGAASVKQLEKQQKKVDYFAEMYSQMRKNVIPHNHYIDEQSVEELRDFDFVFLCIDGGPVKQMIVEQLEKWEISFIDTGMGIQLNNGALRGQLTTTLSTPSIREAARARMSFSDTEAENIYDHNIQLVELNAMNAALAVIKWKRLCGFYHDTKREFFTSFTIAGNLLINEVMS